MLQIGERSYDLVRGQSGFRLILDPSESGDFWQQRWSLITGYVPAESDPGPSTPNAPWEYWRLMINPLWLNLKDWRDLTTYHPENHDVGGFYPYSVTLSNMLLNDGGEVAELRPGEFQIIQREGYLFTCEFYGELDVETPEETADVELRDQIPFATISVRIPINSADPVGAARAIAARELDLTETARSHLTPYQPREGPSRRSLGQDKHQVLLETPWRTGLL